MFRSAPGAFPDIAGLTSDLGEFVLAAPQPGRYEIELAAEGHAPAVVAVDAPASGSVDVEVRIGRQDP